MSYLIKINMDDGGIGTVDARELHAFLESKQDFSTWRKRRIRKYKFIQDTDFVPFHQVVERAIGGAARTEHMITIDMAKELSMVERNAKGRQAENISSPEKRRVKPCLPKKQNPKSSRLPPFRGWPQNSTGHPGWLSSAI